MTDIVAASAPTAALVYRATVDITERISIGRGPLGERFIVPIVGGSFEGERLRGRVLPGGADRQLLRHDGIRELDALYEMQTDDGAIITVHNQVVIDAPADGPRYAWSHVKLTAPDGPHAWLNRRLFVGTVQTLAPRPAVLISVFQVG